MPIFAPTKSKFQTFLVEQPTTPSDAVRRDAFRAVTDILAAAEQARHQLSSAVARARPASDNDGVTTTTSTHDGATIVTSTSDATGIGFTIGMRRPTEGGVNGRDADGTTTTSTHDGVTTTTSTHDGATVVTSTSDTTGIGFTIGVGRPTEGGTEQPSANTHWQKSHRYQGKSH